MCPLRGQSLESRLAAQRGVLRAPSSYSKVNVRLGRPRSEVAQRASDRRAGARRLPFDLAVAGSFGTALALEGGHGTGLWVYFGMALLLGAGGLYGIVVLTRDLAATRPEDRGKRSDDKALAKAQWSSGCLPILVVGAASASALYRFLNDRWPVAPWIIALGGLAGHIVGVAVIAWARSRHRGGPHP